MGLFLVEYLKVIVVIEVYGFYFLFVYYNFDLKLIINNGCV